MSNSQEFLANQREFYKKNLWAFAKDLCNYGDLREKPHWEMCDFLVNTPGNGTVRTTNQPDKFFFKHKVGAGHKPDKRRMLLLAPRNTFKSSVSAKSYILWRLTQNPELKVLVVAYNADKAAEILFEIENKMMNPVFKMLFWDMGSGRNGACRWNKLEKQIWNPDTNSPSEVATMVSLRAVGLGTDVTGLHCDIAVVDDLVTADSFQTRDMREKAKEYLRYLEPIVNPGGEILVDGTRYHEEDAYGWIINDMVEYDIMHRSCWNADGSLYFPERLTEEFLRVQHVVLGDYIFSCQYENNPINEKEQVFKEPWVRRCVELFVPQDPDDVRTMLYIDPAFSKRKRADKTSICVGQMDKKGRIYVPECKTGRWNDDELVANAYQMDEYWKPEAIGIEANIAQQLFVKIFKLVSEKYGKKLNIRPIEHSTKIDKRSRIRTLMPYVERAQILIAAECRELLTEMRRFNLELEENDDNLDALEGVVCMLRPPKIAEVLTDTEKIAKINFNVKHDIGYETKVFKKEFTDSFEDLFK